MNDSIAAKMLELKFNSRQEILMLTPFENENEKFTNPLYAMGCILEALNYLKLSNVTDYTVSVPVSFHEDLKKVVKDASNLKLADFINKPLIKLLNVRIVIRPCNIGGAIHVGIAGDGITDLSDEDMFFTKGSEQSLLGVGSLDTLKPGVYFESPIPITFTTTDHRVLGKEREEINIDGYHRFTHYSTPKSFDEKEAQKLLTRRNKTLDYKLLNGIFGVVLGGSAHSIYQLRSRLGFPIPKINCTTYKTKSKQDCYVFTLV